MTDLRIGFDETAMRKKKQTEITFNLKGLWILLLLHPG